MSRRWIAMMSGLVLMAGCSASQNQSSGLHQSVAKETKATVGPKYFVATSGDDASDGSMKAPWATLDYAAQKAEAGAIVTVQAGNYSVMKPIVLGARATVDQPITIQAATGAKVVLDGADCTDANPDIFTVTGQHYVIRGFEIANAKRIAVNMWGGQHLKVLNCEIHDSVLGALYMGNGASHVIFDGNKVFHNVRKNSNRNIPGHVGWPSAVNLDGEGSVATNNHIYENWGEGIGFYGSNTYAAHNVVHDNYSANVYVNNVENARLEKNFIYTTNKPEFFRELYGGKGPCFGIAMSNEGNKPPFLSNVVIVNNVVVGGLYTLFYWKGSGIGGLQNFTIAHNVFYGGTNGVVKIDRGEHKSSLIANNVFMQPDGFDTAKDWDVRDLSGITLRNNCWHGGKTPKSLSGAGDIYADPLFVNAGNVSAKGFKLQATSPLFNRGAQLKDAKDDFSGIARPQSAAPDIGAFEQ